MEDDAKAPMKATDGKTLEERVMSACTAKSEELWWAKWKIEELQETIKKDYVPRVEYEKVSKGLAEYVAELKAAKEHNKTLFDITVVQMAEIKELKDFFGECYGRISKTL